MKLLRLASYGLLLGGGGILLCLTLLWYHYYDTLPRSPQPETERVHVMNMHGVPVYATHRERDRLDILQNLLFFLMIPGIAGAILTSEDYWRKMGWRYPSKLRAHPPGRSEPPNSHDIKSDKGSG